MTDLFPQDVPDFALLWLPPFPSQTATAEALVPYDIWQQVGITIARQKNGGDVQGPCSLQQSGHDGGLRPLVDISQGHSSEAKASRQNERLGKRLAEGGALVRIRAEDCLKIGEEHTAWQEPEGTANEGQFQIDTPPFERLMSATRDFLYSRSEEFQYHRSRRLFNIVRDSFGLRSDRKGDHWPAGVLEEDLLPEHETCCLLRNTESAVRGFLALARREAEAGWNSEPSLKLCQLVAAFLSYVVHYKVFSDEPFASQFEKAANLARTAPRLLTDSLRVEEAMALKKGWNAATWTLWGCQYGDAGRGGLHTEVWPVDSGDAPEGETGQVVAGGWGEETSGSVQAQVDQGPVEPYMAPLLAPLKVDEIELLEYIPYARRRITQVILPVHDVAKPAYLSQLCCLVTVPSPWTQAEGWRRSPLTDQGDDSETLPDADDAGPLEMEEATVEDPSRLVIWIERSALGDDSTGRSLIGMALRGRWGLFGTASDGAESQWWAFRSKDYILPALWSGQHDDSEAGQDSE